MKIQDILDQRDREEREILELQYEILGVRKQPNGNRENWINGDIARLHQHDLKLLQGIRDEVEKLDGKYSGNEEYEHCRHEVLALLNIKS